MARNGYLRQVEFRRWADSVDEALRNLTIRVEEHGKLLAVYDAFSKRSDVNRTIIGSLIAALVAAIVGALMHAWLH